VDTVKAGDFTATRKMVTMK